MGVPIAVIGISEDDEGRIVVSNVSTKFKANGAFVAFEGTVLDGDASPPTATLISNLSTKTKVEGKFVGMIGSVTDESSTIVSGEPKMTVI